MPSVGEICEINKKDVARKNSVMLPNGSSSMMDGGKAMGSSLAAAGSSVIGGIDNYKRYQMLVAQSMNTGGANNSNKRSQSLLEDNPKKYPIKRTVTMNDNNNRRKTSKLS